MFIYSKKTFFLFLLLVVFVVMADKLHKFEISSLNNLSKKSYRCKLYCASLVYPHTTIMCFKDFSWVLNDAKKKSGVGIVS